MKLRKSCFGMDYEMESLILALVIQINLIWNQFHGIIHELIRYAHALTEGWRDVLIPGASDWCKVARDRITPHSTGVFRLVQRFTSVKICLP